MIETVAAVLFLSSPSSPFVVEAVGGLIITFMLANLRQMGKGYGAHAPFSHFKLI